MLYGRSQHNCQAIFLQLKNKFKKAPAPAFGMHRVCPYWVRVEASCNSSATSALCIWPLLLFSVKVLKHASTSILLFFFWVFLMICTDQKNLHILHCLKWKIKGNIDYFFSLSLNFNPFIFWLHRMPCRIVIPQPGIKPMPPAVDMWSLIHWATREVSACSPLEVWQLGSGPHCFTKMLQVTWGPSTTRSKPFPQAHPPWLVPRRSLWNFLSTAVQLSVLFA